MDFFEYASLALQFVNSNTLYVPLVVGALCFLTVFIFEAVGLFTIAGHEGYKNRWMAFIPFVNTYYIGVTAQKNRAFRSVNTKYLALAAAILEFLLVISYIVYFIALFSLFGAGSIKSTEQATYYGTTSVLYSVDYNRLPVGLGWAAWCYEYLDTINYVLNLVFMVLQIFVFTAFFQTYAARHYFIFTIFSVLFPVFGIIAFIVRNNSGMNYREYMRREQEKRYRMYQQYSRQNFENNPYNQNPYSRGGYDYGAEARNERPASRSDDDPFSEFGGKSCDNSDPFEN